MLLIDGAKYELWKPPNEDEFERVVKEHMRDIFGEKSIYLDIKQKLRSVSGIGSIWDGCAIVFGDPPQWHIIEAELSCHLTYEHIITQVGKFIGGIGNNYTQRKIVDAIHDELTRDEFLRLRIRKNIEPTEIYKFLADLISIQPVITIIIEKETDELKEAIKTLHYPKIKIVEFQTFTREGTGLAVHAHLFEPIYAPLSPPPPPPEPPTGKRVIAGKVTFEELISAGLLRDQQILYFYHTRPFIDERAQVLASSNQLKYEIGGRTYSKSELAKILLIKHGFKHDEHGVAGPKYWKTEDGKLLLDLEEQVRVSRGDRS